MKASDFDYSVLEYVAQFDSVDENKILAEFPNDKFRTGRRLGAMSGVLAGNPENCVPSLLENRIDYQNCGTAHSVECFRITENGRLVLEELRSRPAKKSFSKKILGATAKVLPLKGLFAALGIVLAAE